MPRDIVEYHKSTARELDAVKDRVRNLIDNQWAHDGRHKEAILKNVIKQFLPKKFDIGTGFVVRREEGYGLGHEHSNQIDIIVYDTSFPLLFIEGDFVITTPEAVRGIIEVKTNAESQGLLSIIRKMNKNGLFIYGGKNNKSRPLFNGLFSYDGFDDIGRDITAIMERVGQPIIDTFYEHRAEVNVWDYVVNHISLNKNIFLKHWFDFNGSKEYSLYNLEGLSYAYFISNLLYFVTDENIQR